MGAIDFNQLLSASLTSPDPCWEQSVLKMVEMRDQEQDIPTKDWSKECVEKWQELSKKLGASGIKLTADFL
jgi:hypothetical protein